MNILELDDIKAIDSRDGNLTQGCEYLGSVKGVSCRCSCLVLPCRGLRLHLAPSRSSGSPECLIERIVTPYIIKDSPYYVMASA